MAGMFGKTPKTPKHGACIEHAKLPCGCKVCVTPQSTAHNDRPSLVEFHAAIHAIQAARAARPRYAGTGQPIEPMAWTVDGIVPYAEVGGSRSNISTFRPARAA